MPSPVDIQVVGFLDVCVYLLNVGLTRTRVPTATPEDDRGEKAEPRRYALLTLIRHGVGGEGAGGFIRRPHLHQTRRTGAGESLAPRLLATRYYYRTRSGDAPEKTASRNCAASS